MEEQRKEVDLSPGPGHRDGSRPDPDVSFRLSHLWPLLGLNNDLFHSGATVQAREHISR